MTLRNSCFIVLVLAGLSIGIYYFILPQIATRKTYAGNFLGPKTGLRWIDTQADKMGLRDKEIVLKDAYSTHFKNPDGTVTGLFTGFKQNYEVAPGIWEPIDYSLEKSTDPRYDYQTKNGVGIYLSKNGSIAQKDGDALLESGAPTLGIYNPVSNSFIRLNNLDNPKVNKTDNLLTLDGQDVKLVVYALDIGAREDLILENSTLVDNANLDDLLTLKAAIDSTGSLTLNGQSLDTKYNIPNPKYELTTKDSLVLEDGDKTINFPFPEGHDAKDNPATIRRFLIKEGDSWYLYTSVPVMWLKKLSTSYPVTIDPDYAGDTADGQVYGSSSTYSTARSTSSAFDITSATFTLGQGFVDPTYIVRRGFVQFVTSAIPNNAIINQVNMTLVATADNSTNDFTARIYGYNWSASNPLTSVNQETAYDECRVTAVDANWRNTLGMSLYTQYTSSNLDTTWPSKTGSTYYCLKSNLDHSNITPTQTEWIRLGAEENATAEYRPVLTIIYSPVAPSQCFIGEGEPCAGVPQPPPSTESSFYASFWVDETTDGSNGYRLDVSTVSNFASFVTGYNDLAIGNVTGYWVTGLSANTTYYYRLRATSSVGTGTSSNSLTYTGVTAPAVPAPLSATSITATSFTARWSTSTGANDYRLDVATNSGFTSYVTGLQDLGVGVATTYAVSSLTCGTNYYYRVRAANEYGTSSSSSTINPITIPCAPTVNPGVAVDSVSTSTGASVASLTWSHTVSGSNRLLVVGVTMRAYQTISSVTYAGTALTKSGAVQAGTGNNPRAEIWYLLNPATGANNVVVTPSGNEYLEAGAISFTGVYQTTPLGSFASNSAASGYTATVNVPSATGDLVLDVLKFWNGSGESTKDASQTQRWYLTSDGGHKGAGSTKPGAAVVQMSWTKTENNAWAHAGVAIKSYQSSTSQNGFSANWSSSTGATAYKLDVSTVSNFTSYVSGFQDLNVGDVTTYSVPSLSCGTSTYYYRVRASSSNGDSNSSGTITVSTSPTVCPSAVSGNVSTVCSCAFTDTVDGLDAGDLSIGANTTLTMNSGKTVIWPPGKKISINGNVIINNTGNMKQGYIVFTDNDNDGIPNSSTPTFSSSAPSGTTKQRSTLTSYTTVDCNDNNAAIYQGC